MNRGPWRRWISRLKVEVPGFVAAGFVDLDKGDWVALEMTGSHAEEFQRFLAGTTREYFEGDAVKTIGSVVDGASGDVPLDREIEEVILRSTHYLHILQRLLRYPRVVLGVVTVRESKLGMIRSAMGQVLEEELEDEEPEEEELEDEELEDEEPEEPDELKTVELPPEVD